MIDSHALFLLCDLHQVTVKARLDKFHSLTVPILKYFETKGLLTVVNTMTSKEAYATIQTTLGSI